MTRRRWFAVRRAPTARQRLVLTLLAFLLPLGAWCAVAYVPWLWHPLVRVTAAGDGRYAAGQLIDKVAFNSANEELSAAGQVMAAGDPANPVFLPPPHAVAKALVTAFTTPPKRKGEPWLHESMLH